VSDGLGKAYLEDVHYRFASLKRLADGALAQTRTGFFTVIGPEDNSLAILVKHMSGNMIARWSDLSGDGEPVNRERDLEFIVQEDRSALMAQWERGWQTLFDALESLTPEALIDTITVRGEPLTIVAAINRQLAHYNYHVGQIVFLAKHFRGTDWQTLSIPKGQSERFNQEMRAKNETKG